MQEDKNGICFEGQVIGIWLFARTINQVSYKAIAVELKFAGDWGVLIIPYPYRDLPSVSFIRG